MTHAQLLVAVILTQQLLFAAVWYGAARLRIARYSAHHWGAATGLTAAAMLLISMRGSASVWLTFVLANVLLVASFIALRRGLQVFARMPPSDGEHLFVLGGVTVVMVAAVATDADFVILVCVSLTLSWILLRIAWEVRHGLAEEFGSRTALWCAMPLAAISGIFLLRAVLGPLYFARGIFGPSISAAGVGNTGLMFVSMLFGLVINGTLLSVVFVRMVRRLQHQSDHDPLTGLLSRRPMQRLLEAEAARRSSPGRAFALLYIDIDRFKAINDQHGHAVGDVVLRRVAQALRGAARTGDAVARMGGEEFCIFLHGADEASAQRAAQRLLDTVRGLDHPEAGAQLKVTISIGLALAQAERESMDELMLRADRALYVAKQTGRDRVVLAQPPQFIAGYAAVCRVA